METSVYILYIWTELNYDNNFVAYYSGCFDPDKNYVSYDDPNDLCNIRLQ